MSSGKYQLDEYPTTNDNADLTGPTSLKIGFASIFCRFGTRFNVDAVTAATCDKYCDYRVKLIKAAQPDREGTRAFDLDLNTLSNAFQWAIRAELVKTNPLATGLITTPRAKSSIAGKRCRGARMNFTNSQRFSSIAETNSAVLGWQTLAEGLTGLRTCEALGLRTDAPPYEPGWITPDGKSLCVRRAKASKP